MKIVRKIYTVRELCAGFEYDILEGKGLFGLLGLLIIQPGFQRLYLYGEKGGLMEIEVIYSLLAGVPIGVLCFNKIDGGMMEVLDGQQRITSIGRFITNHFAIKDEYGHAKHFDSLSPEQQNKILDTEIVVFECEGDEAEVQKWFRKINTVGLELKDQEILNAVYAGPFVTLARAEFSNSHNSNIQTWSYYIRGNVKRQDFLERALQWLTSSKGETVDHYMSAHRYDTNIDELKTYFNKVIDWILSVFTGKPKKEMYGLEWGRLYETYHKITYDSAKVAELVEQLLDDPYIHTKHNIFEYILGGCVDKQLLELRFFDEATKRVVYKKQTDAAREKGESNCPLCALSDTPNKTKIWERKEMDADHVSAWSKGGATTADNCQMLCVTHNRAKGNK